MNQNFYRYLQMKLFEHSRSGNVVNKEEAYEVLGYFRIPKALRYYVIKDMIESEMLEIINDGGFLENGKQTKKMLLRVKDSGVSINQNISPKTRRKNYVKEIIT